MAKEETNFLDPWKASEVKNYEKLMRDLGVESTKTLLKKIPKNYYFTRNIAFGHKSFETVLQAIDGKKPFAMLTGLMPSGKFHFGHKAITDLMIYFQKLGADCHICVADIESYLTRNIPLAQAREVALNEYLLNYIALGLQPKKTKFYFQSEGSKEYMNLSKIIANKVTFNELQGIYGELTPGKIISAFTQVADILYPQLSENGGPKPVIVPVGADQVPHINLSRDIAQRMKDYKFIPPSATFIKFMPGLKGIHTKMSSSQPDTAIFLTDTPEDVAKKIKKYAFSGGKDTLEEHRKHGGNPDIDISYQWLTFLEEDDKKLENTYHDYKSGKLLSGELKQLLIDKINTFLQEHQKRRKKAEQQLHKFIYSP
ncbi:MAG TPA: tryptophan--tRNA ligase [Candidatus Nanoarchaeia archaeon]|nr:tryptophan--tRNA ligase [Candidatus Nanoarchaeia archaeon]